MFACFFRPISLSFFSIELFSTPSSTSTPFAFVCYHAMLLATSVFRMIYPAWHRVRKYRDRPLLIDITNFTTFHLHISHLSNCKLHTSSVTSPVHYSYPNVFPLPRRVDPLRRLRLHGHPLRNLNPRSRLPSSSTIPRPLRCRDSASTNLLGPLQQVPPCKRRSRPRLAHMSTGLG